jgi:fructose-1,6-bisphosphatase I
MGEFSPVANIETIQQHILRQQRKHSPNATGEFSWLLSGITLATKIIAAKVRRAGLVDVLGAAGSRNVHDEEVQKLDVLANETLLKCLGSRGNVALMASEENDEPVVVRECGADGRYIVIFDPLDGSSNIDCNVSIGTIFSIFERRTGRPDESHEDRLASVLQPGTRQLAAGYVIYGSSTQCVYTTGHGVHLFCLDPSFGAYVLVNEHLRMPASGKTYSVNEALAPGFSQGLRRYLDWVKTKEAGPYSSRYVGSLVADFHRTLIKGGVFLYPGTPKAPEGKLRLLYEAFPMAFIAEQAGGLATDGNGRILDRVPESLHQRTPLVIGSAEEVRRVLEFMTRD